MLYYMSVSEARRHDLYNGLNELLGADRADTLMTYLPIETDLATKGDLFDLEARLGARMDGLDARMERLEVAMDGFNRRLDRFFLTMLTALFAMVVTFMGSVFLG